MSGNIYQVIGGALKKSSNLTQKGLAEALGLNPAAVNRMLHGQRKIKVDEIPTIEEYLGMCITGSSSNDNGKFKVPLYDENEDSKGFVSAHPSQNSEADSFALRLGAEYMEPRYFYGEIIYADKSKLPEANKDCVVKTIDGKLHIRRFVSQASGELLVEIYNPEQQQIFDEEHIEYICAIVGRG